LDITPEAYLNQKDLHEKLESFV